MEVGSKWCTRSGVYYEVELTWSSDDLVGFRYKNHKGSICQFGDSCLVGVDARCSVSEFNASFIKRTEKT